MTTYRTDSQMATWADDSLRDWWDERWESHGSLRNGAWYYVVYAEAFVGKRVLEIGSGFGFDAIYFAGRGAQWTCCDIAIGNLQVIDRIAHTKGVADRIVTHYIDDDFSFDGVGKDFDVIWANGSLINLPFAMARRECAGILPRLRPGGRWIELAYPPERWRRDGAPPFSEWGRMTDGPRTPWMEWYDLPKLRRRLAPANFATLLSFSYAGGVFNWFDLVLDQPRPVTRMDMERPLSRVKLDLSREQGTFIFPYSTVGRSVEGVSITTSSDIWAYSYALDLVSVLPPEIVGGATEIVVECQIQVDAGTLGVALATPDLASFTCRETFVDSGAGPGSVRCAVRAAELSRLVIRNAAKGQSRGSLLGVELSWQ